MMSLCETHLVFTFELLPLSGQRLLSALRIHAPMPRKKSGKERKQQVRKRVETPLPLNCNSSGLVLLKVIDNKTRRKPWDAFDDPFLSQYIEVTAGDKTYLGMFCYFSVEAYTTTQYTTLCWSLCIQGSKCLKSPISVEH
jgi:hypothetical protein